LGGGFLAYATISEEEAEAILRDKTRWTPEYERHVRTVLHRLWSKAVASSDYNKSEWRQLCAVLQRCGFDV